MQSKCCKWLKDNYFWRFEFAIYLLMFLKAWDRMIGSSLHSSDHWELLNSRIRRDSELWKIKIFKYIHINLIERQNDRKGARRERSRERKRRSQHFYPLFHSQVVTTVKAMLGERKEPETPVRLPCGWQGLLLIPNTSAEHWILSGLRGHWCGHPKCSLNGCTTSDPGMCFWELYAFK